MTADLVRMKKLFKKEFKKIEYYKNNFYSSKKYKHIDINK